MLSTKESEFEFIQGLTADLSAPLLVFPTSMQAAMNIRHIVSQGTLPNDRLARVISTEPVLLAQVLKLSNSAEVNRDGKITTDPLAAITRLGFVQVRNLAISVAMKQLTGHRELDSGIAQLMDGLWNRSLRVATLSLVIARTMTKVNPNHALVAGLLHDVGKFYILNRAKHYQSLFTSLPTLWSMVDAWHSNIGSAILENWAVPDEVCHAVQNLGNLDYEHRGAANLTDVIVAANLLDAHFEKIPSRTIDWNKLPPALHHLTLDAGKSDELHKASRVELGALLSSVE
jgi:putative nucleotidyltransferase with HDIG domain